MKNIPIAYEADYIKILTQKIESLIRRMRWKAYFFKNQTMESSNDNFGFKSDSCPPTDELLNPFEQDLYILIQEIEFRQYSNPFLRKLDKDKKEIQKSKNVFVFADKTTNLYEVSANEYNKLLTENITQLYKKTENTTLSQVNSEAKTISDSYRLSNRVECYAPRESFITLKDHKENFESNVKCRLLNPAKSEIGKISKQLLERYSNELF